MIYVGNDFCNADLTTLLEDKRRNGLAQLL